MDSRRSLISAGREVFAARGYAAAGTREILEKAGSTAPTLYHHFGNKAGLYMEVVGEVDDEIASAFRAALPGSETLLDRLDAILDVTLELHSSDATMVNLVAGLPIEIRRNADLSHNSGLKRIQHLREFLFEMCSTASDLRTEPEIAANAITTLIYGLGRLAPVVDRAGMASAIESVKALSRGALTEQVSGSIVASRGPLDT